MKKIKSILLVSCLLLFGSCFCYAQNAKIDSLLNLLKTDKQDTNRVIHLNLLSIEYRNIGSYDTAAVFANQALAICNSPFEGGKGDVLTDKQIASLTLAMTRGKAIAYNNLGNVNLFQGNYPKALDYFLKALKINEELKDKKGTAAVLGNIGLVYYKQADYPKALDYYFKALKINEESGNKKNMSNNLGNIGGIYMQQANYPKALDYYFRALKMAEELGDKNRIAIWLGNIGAVYTDQATSPITPLHKRGELFPKALDYYFKALKMKEELGDKNSVAINLGNIGGLFTETGKYKEAETYLLDALKIDKEIGAQDEERQTEEALSGLYEKTGRHKGALLHYKKAIVLKDTIFSEENKKSLIRKEMNYQYEKKEALAKADQDKKDAIALEEKQKQQVILYSVVAGLLLVAVFAVFITLSLRITRKQKHIIELQKEEVSRQKEMVDKAYAALHEKNEEVMASIRYAKRIQDALMTSEKYIHKTLNRLMGGKA
ncbi:MAG TPA: tetratricopeptide repeat protein [Bacteroidia bacterium]